MNSRRLWLIDVVTAIAGGVAVVYGVSCWSAPAAWILGGGGLVALAVWPARSA